MVGENGPQLDGWTMPTRCCGEWSSEVYCGTCGNLMPDTLRIAPNIVLGTE